MTEGDEQPFNSARVPAQSLQLCLNFNMKFPPDHNCNFVLLQFPTFGCTREVKNLRGRVQQIRSSDYQHRWRELGIRTRGCRLVEPLSDLWLAIPPIRLVLYHKFVETKMMYMPHFLSPITLNLMT